MLLQGLFAWVFFGETLSLRWAAGAASIAAGTVVLLSSARPHRITSGSSPLKSPFHGHQL